VPGVDQQLLRAAADAYAAARVDYEAVKRAADAAYERLEASPETIEYQIDWNVTRREEASAAWRFKQAEKSYLRAGGYVAGDEE
jgi:hypothetical protein